MKKNHKKCKDCKRLIACDKDDSEETIESLITTTQMSAEKGLCAPCYRKRCSLERKQKKICTSAADVIE